MSTKQDGYCVVCGVAVYTDPHAPTCSPEHEAEWEWRKALSAMGKPYVPREESPLQRAVRTQGRAEGK